MTFLIIFTGLVTNVPRQMSLYKFPGSILLSCLYVYIYIYIYICGLRYRHILLFYMVSTALTSCFVFALLSYTIQLHLLLS